MTRLAPLLALIAAMGLPLAAQESTTAFEVASVKPNDSGAPRSGTSTPPGGRFEGTNVTLQQLIKVAYDVRDVQIVGGPAWVKSDRFDVTGKIPDGAPPTNVPEMVKSLLSDRFRLIIHREAREQPVYALVLARPDRKLGPALRMTNCVGNGCGNMSTNENNGSGAVRGVSRSMSDIAAWIADRVDRDVVDRTRLGENYDFELKYMSARVGGALPSGDMPPSLFTALQEQLGLKLEGTRAPVEFIMIDRAERPTPD
jgi:uncharacterized protein (TIGR03435 family)